MPNSFVHAYYNSIILSSQWIYSILLSIYYVYSYRGAFKVFIVQLEQLCNQKGISVTNFIKNELHMSTGNLGSWSNGGTPGLKTLNRIAEYFNVSTDYLLGKEKSPELPGDENDPWLLARKKLDTLPADQRQRIYKVIDSTIDTFLEALEHENKK